MQSDLNETWSGLLLLTSGDIGNDFQIPTEILETSKISKFSSTSWSVRPSESVLAFQTPEPIGRQARRADRYRAGEPAPGGWSSPAAVGAAARPRLQLRLAARRSALPRSSCRPSPARPRELARRCLLRRRGRGGQGKAKSSRRHPGAASELCQKM